ncbi:sucrase ferredoxin [Gloeocapsopsis dulcis]|uniref:Sucrase ferredoxin n=1 Tax=Gloeocapsopsis dulcis AAB1 = 1H9 TaxID=1433147 RepID=A0A6N8FTP8_9CHRO|nr:sucrase ferredoxin [Gloeocapsopsis dulcis]MUL36500.1 sucrase ferredoxin [Gloeocapsopsis dulcis AAB1 = 1H9]WNN87785.1 sucrase ferredoxin [Gloeocapsopsis dulcis]
MNISTQKTHNNCRFCSEISQANGEDPIGSANNAEQCFIIEAAQPWPDNIWMEPDPIPQDVLNPLKFIWENGGSIRPLAIAPDKEYSHPDYTRVFYYRRPAKFFAQFEKHEFIVPHALLGSLALALLKNPEEIPNFEQYRQQTNHIRELFVCNHGNVDAACSRFGYPLYQKLRSEYAAANNNNLRFWRCSHFGGHEFAPTLVDLPQGQYWGHLKPEILDLLILRNGSVKELYPYYRGRASLSFFEQIAEREIWMLEGWRWLEYHKAGQVLASDEINQEWADVRIDFTTADGNISSAYQARVEVKGSVMTAWKSGANPTLEEVKQYHVTSLVKLT